MRWRPSTRAAWAICSSPSRSNASSAPWAGWRIARPTETSDEGALETILVEIGSLTKIIAREDVSWVESAGDYVRLHLRGGGQHLVRMPISLLEEQWSDHGFQRIHRSYLVALRDIHELRTSEGHTVVGVGDFDLPVSRRHSKELRDRLVRHARRDMS